MTEKTACGGHHEMVWVSEIVRLIISRSRYSDLDNYMHVLDFTILEIRTISQTSDFVTVWLSRSL